MAFPLGAALTGIGSIVGGLFGQSGAQAGARSAVRGAKINAKAARWASRQNLKYQKQFAKKGLSWRIKDAKMAGIHPLAALGAQVNSFSPSFVSGNPGDGMIEAGRIQAAGASDMGQAIGRAASAFGDIDDRNNQYLAKMQELQLQNAQLNNAVLASQVANLNQPGNPPPTPTNRWLVDGQGSATLGRSSAGSPLVQDQPLQRTVSNPGNLSQEPGAVTDMGFTRTTSGHSPVMSKDAKERLEEDWIGGLTWNLRNRVLQNLQLNLNPPYPAPKGQHWKYNPVKQEYQLWDDKYSISNQAKSYLRDTNADRTTYSSGGGGGF